MADLADQRHMRLKWGYSRHSQHDLARGGRCRNTQDAGCAMPWYLVWATGLLGVVFLPLVVDGLEPPPETVALQYLRALYARDLSVAYRFLSGEDQRLKDEVTYRRERGAFNGFTLEVAKKLAGFIEATVVEQQITPDQAWVKLKVPYATPPGLAELLLGWDEERLNALAPTAQAPILQRLEGLHQDRKLPFLEGEERLELVREGESWRVFLNWAAGIHIHFEVRVPDSLPLDTKLDQQEALIRPGELFNVTFRVKNRAHLAVESRIAHHVEPKAVAAYLQVVECGGLFPVRLGPGDEEEYTSTYLLQGELPAGVKRLEVTYEFQR